MSKAYECDRCGMLFKPYKNQKTSEFLNITKNPNCTGNCLDLCPKCNDKLQEWVENGKVQVKYSELKEEISKDDAIKIVHDTLHDFFVDSETFNDKEKFLLKINKAICNNIKGY